jgi:hypothetical protein
VEPCFLTFAALCAMSASVDADAASQLGFGSEDLEGSLSDLASEVAADETVSAADVACESRRVGSVRGTSE